ncbi:hypothetical protein H9Y04_35595 [Streptomyces sp. TRM66268-LWL]|uniref:Uncharacterized protein n=1 Tax=Streptomyces polyasparticus TaxID=2767826 RepID=A0ABR7SSJ9_9ACTN|nr:hypothetical protein [Streptomyces polyasparticus]MBC9717869.1 hypothetical protein [Streptomyces polyasparticus]
MRITLSPPRWTLPYELQHRVPELAPARTYFQSPRAEFEAAYRSQLDGHGIDQFASRFQEIAVESGDLRLVLLCFEDLEQVGEWCHRRMFADWWQERTGAQVRELGPLGPAFEQGVLM